MAALGSYGLTYCFAGPAGGSDGGDGESGEGVLAPCYAALPGTVLPRPAPLAPGIDALHAYSDLPRRVGLRPGALGCSGGGAAASSASGPGVMPLVLRQGLAQALHAARLTRLEQVWSCSGGVWGCR